MSADAKSVGRTVTERILDTNGVMAALRKARRNALAEHSRAGSQVPVWRDGRVEWVLPTLDGEIPGDVESAG